tara:strand:- start:593 stop:760 length:168 start_codon:yes stop_codon:yes gene_type:complete
MQAKWVHELLPECLSNGRMSRDKEMEERSKKAFDRGENFSDCRLRESEEWMIQGV